FDELIPLVRLDLRAKLGNGRLKIEMILGPGVHNGAILLAIGLNVADAQVFPQSRKANPVERLGTDARSGQPPFQFVDDILVEGAKEFRALRWQTPRAFDQDGSFPCSCKRSN